MAERFKILAVDDEAGLLKILKKLLEPTYEVHLAMDGNEALRKVDEVHPDVILLDRKLPGLDGIAVLGQLKSNEVTRNIPVIMLSANGETDELEVGKQAGAVDYLVKPFELKELRAVIIRHLPSSGT